MEGDWNVRRNTARSVLQTHRFTPGQGLATAGEMKKYTDWYRSQSARPSRFDKAVFGRVAVERIVTVG